MRTAVLFLIFNRPDTTFRVFEIISQARPPRLYIAADGPRKNKVGELEKCEETRSIVEKVDWDCEVKTLFRDENLGCGYAPYTAINWFFQNENEGIILEDDCMPSLPFFSYCDYLLAKYRNDQRVWMVSGTCYEEDLEKYTSNSYLFSKYGHTWGWGTWKRCWEQCDMEMENFRDFVKIGGFYNICSSKEAYFLTRLFAKLSADKELQSHAWDYQWFLTRLMNGLSIVPSKNLVQNIGLYGTHFDGGFIESHKCDEYYTVEREPQFVMVNRNYEISHLNMYIKPKSFIKCVLHRLLKYRK